MPKETNNHRLKTKDNLDRFTNNISKKGQIIQGLQTDMVVKCNKIMVNLNKCKGITGNKKCKQTLKV